MKQWLTKTIAFLFVFAFAVNIFVMPTQVYAQLPVDSGCGDTIPADDPRCSTAVGGAGITAASIRSAIDSPTPNLANTTAYIFYTISILLTGTFDPTYDPTTESGAPALEGSLNRPSSLAHSLERHGVIGGVAFLTSEMYTNQPASAQTYFADLIQNSKLTGTPAYAQGIGFGALNPILGTWKAFRDVAYYLLTVMFLVTGFLILIRHKVSGNVAVTVQNALPKLVVTLILITFSYAIAGLIVDLMYLVLYFIIGIFSGQIFDGPIQLGFLAGEKSLSDLAFNTHIFEFTVGYVFNTGEASAWGAASAVGDIVYNALSTFGPVAVLFGPGTILESLFSTLIKIMFTIIFGIALLIAMFRTFFSLVMSYAGFVINVVLSPFILLAGAIPGKDPWKNWVKNLIGGLAPFVVVVFMIFMSLALTGSSTRPGIGYDPNALDGQAGLRLPLILGGDIDAGSFIGVLAMGFMLLMPEAVKMTKKIVGASGGIFDEYKDAAVGNLKKGWTGDSSVPFIPSGRSIAKGAAAGGVIGGGVGLAGGYAAGSSLVGKAATGDGRFSRLARFSGGVLGAGLGGTLMSGGGAIIGGAGIPAVNKVQSIGKSVSNINKKYGEPINNIMTKNRERVDLQRGETVLNTSADASANASNNQQRSVNTTGPKLPIEE